MQKRFFKYITLNMLGALGLSGYILADTFFVANRLGSNGLAALNLAISVFGLINGLGMLLGIGGATRYSICRYQGDEERANRTFTAAAAWGVLLGLGLALAGGLWAGPLAAMLGAETLLVEKTACGGVTVAVAAEHWEVRFGKAVCGGHWPRRL